MQIDQDINSIRVKLEGIGERELSIKKDYQRVSSQYSSLHEEIVELGDFKRVKELMWLSSVELIAASWIFIIFGPT